MVNVLAVTGGIGCGKSYIVKVFAAMGVPAYLADERTKALYYNSAELQQRLVEMLGGSIFMDGVLQTAVMAKMIFSDRDLLSRVEALVHPFVQRDFEKWRDGYSGVGEGVAVGEGTVCPFLILESAIFLEKPEFRSFADKVMTISSSQEIRINRVTARDGIMYDDVMARMRNQWTDEQREAVADFIVVSDQERAILPQIISVYEKMI